jgi:hypothetical protein
MLRSIALLPLLLACDAELVCAPGFVNVDEVCSFSEAEVASLMTRFDQGELVKINSEVFMDYAVNVERNVWVSPVPLGEDTLLTAVDLYQEIDPNDDETILSQDFPVGTLIVHERIDGFEGHTVQVKLGADFSDELGRDWWFGKFYDDGTADEVACEPCENCHSQEQRPNTDGLWGVASDFR